jgi:hypothetical protein
VSYWILEPGAASGWIWHAAAPVAFPIRSRLRLSSLNGTVSMTMNIASHGWRNVVNSDMVCLYRPFDESEEYISPFTCSSLLIHERLVITVERI